MGERQPYDRQEDDEGVIRVPRADNAGLDGQQGGDRAKGQSDQSRARQQPPGSRDDDGGDDARHNEDPANADSVAALVRPDKQHDGEQHHPPGGSCTRRYCA
jgi:hypothetical protein